MAQQPREYQVQDGLLIEHIDGATETINREIAAALKDIEQNPYNPKPRIVTVKLPFKPVVDGPTHEVSVQTGCMAKHALPARQSRISEVVLENTKVAIRGEEGQRTVFEEIEGEDESNVRELPAREGNGS